MPKVIVKSPKNNQDSVIVTVVKRTPEGGFTEQKVAIPDGEERSFTVDRGQELRITSN